MEKRKVAVGVDFGGTAIKMALVDDHGEIHARNSLSTADSGSQTAFLDAVETGIDRLGRECPGLTGTIAGIGVGVPGFVDFKRGYIFDLTNVEGWTGVGLAPLLEDRLGMRAVVDNDVNVMAAGEGTFGAGRLYQHAVFVTLGTGVGGALMIDNHIYRGAYSMAGEIGHMSIDREGIASPQGFGGLEQYVGNRRIVARATDMLEAGRDSSLRDRCGGRLADLSLKMIAEAAQEGDALGVEIFDYYADCLATVIASVTYLLQPQAFIIGGGVAAGGDILFEPLRRHVNRRLSPVFAERVEIREAELGNQAGVIGGATMAMAR